MRDAGTSGVAQYDKKAWYLGNDFYFLCLKAFLPLDDGELDPLAFFERAIPCAVNSAVMHKYITTCITGYKTKPFGRIEPLDGSSLTIRHKCTNLLVNEGNGMGSALHALEDKTFYDT